MHDWQIRMGTLVPGHGDLIGYLRQIKSYGFESYSINFTDNVEGINLADLAKQVREEIADTGAVISSVSAFGNPLLDDSGAKVTREAWEKLIDAAHMFGCDIVTGFTGRVIDIPIDKSIPRYVEVFKPLAQRAEDKGVRLAFENCEMGGNWERGGWNIAHTPDTWELMFDALPAENMGLQWEPCHQMVKLIDPISQLRKWVKKVFHVHGKDATVMWDVIREHGIGGPHAFAYHRTPGYGDSNWSDIITILTMAGFKGSIDIEGWHDPVYRGDLELTGQVKGVDYLKNCRALAYVPNPK